MADAKIPRPLRGVIPPMVTPLLGRDQLDHAGLERLIERLLAGGVSGLYILGTTGEAPALSYRLRHELIARTCRQVAGRVAVLVGITDPALVESVSLASKAAEFGAQAAVIAPPYYFSASQSELLGYLERLADQSALPLFLYNAPTNTHHSLDPATVRRAGEIPKIIGLKDSSANMIYFHAVQRLLEDRPDFTLLVGPEELMAEAVLLGGHGGMCGGTNFYPRLYVDLYRETVAGNLDEVRRLQRRVMQISMTVYHVSSADSSYLRGVKCAMSLLGICSDFMAEPFQAFDSAEREQVRLYLLAAGLLGEEKP